MGKIFFKILIILKSYTVKGYRVVLKIFSIFYHFVLGSMFLNCIFAAP